MIFGLNKTIMSSTYFLVVNNNKKSAVKDHCLFFNHMGSFEDFSILTYESNPLKLLIKEALLVSRDKPLLNKQVKSIPLQLF